MADSGWDRYFNEPAMKVRFIPSPGPYEGVEVPMREAEIEEWTASAKAYGLPPLRGGGANSWIVFDHIHLQNLDYALAGHGTAAPSPVPSDFTKEDFWTFVENFFNHPHIFPSTAKVFGNILRADPEKFYRICKERIDYLQNHKPERMKQIYDNYYARMKQTFIKEGYGRDTTVRWQNDDKPLEALEEQQLRELERYYRLHKKAEEKLKKMKEKGEV